MALAQKTDELINDLAGRVQGGKTRIEGEIKLTILAPFAGILMGAISQFRAENPHCLVQVDVSEDLAKLEYGEAHIALRAGAKPEHPDYVVSQFGHAGFNLYAHDNYVAQQGLPKDESDLHNHSIALADFPKDRLPWGDWITRHVPPERIALTSRDVWVTAEAVWAGLGIGFVAETEAQSRGHLHPVLPANPAWRIQAWIVTQIDLHRTQKVQAMLRCIKAVSATKTQV